MIDRNLVTSYLIVDEMHKDHPELLKDQYWNDTPQHLSDRTESTMGAEVVTKDTANYELTPRPTSILRQRFTRVSFNSKYQEEEDSGDVELGESTESEEKVRIMTPSRTIPTASFPDKVHTILGHYESRPETKVVCRLRAVQKRRRRPQGTNHSRSGDGGNQAAGRQACRVSKRRTKAQDRLSRLFSLQNYNFYSISIFLYNFIQKRAFSFFPLRLSHFQICFFQNKN